MDVKASESNLGEQVIKKCSKYTFKQKLALVMLACADFMSFCAMSIPAPFYPKEASNKGMTESVAGFVFGFYALVVFLSSPIFGKVLPNFGIKLIYIVGLMLSGICSILFGTLHRIEDLKLFTALSFLVRGFTALGASAYSIATFVLIVNIYPENAGAVRGILETFIGLGMSAGPGIGGLLFAVGGFELPFYVVGFAVIFIAVLNFYLLPPTDKCYIDEKSGSFTKIIKLFPVIMACLILIVDSMTITFLDPTLEPHLRKFQLKPEYIGLIFLLFSGTYGISCPIWGWLTDRTNISGWFMTTGLLCNSFILLFLGPSSILNFMEDSLWLNILTLSILGIFTAMVLIPTYQSILDSSLENGFKDNLGTHSIVAGLWSSAYSLGEMLGPILGAVLKENFDFSTTTTIFSLLNVVTAICAILYLTFKNKKGNANLSSIEKFQEKHESYNNIFTISHENVNGLKNRNPIC